jgi:hypothetical protein
MEVDGGSVEEVGTGEDLGLEVEREKVGVEGAKLGGFVG